MSITKEAFLTIEKKLKSVGFNTSNLEFIISKWENYLNTELKERKYDFTKFYFYVLACRFSIGELLFLEDEPKSQLISKILRDYIHSDNALYKISLGELDASLIGKNISYKHFELTFNAYTNKVGIAPPSDISVAASNVLIFSQDITIFKTLITFLDDKSLFNIFDQVRFSIDDFLSNSFLFLEESNNVNEAFEYVEKITQSHSFMDG